MEPTPKPRQSAENAIESWDDDDDLQGFDDLQFRHASSTTASSQVNPRDSISSRMSTRSDRESNGGGDEDWQVLLPTEDETSTADVITSVKSAGIPIPQNVPSSALLGGTIKRLGGKRIKKVLVDDWGEDLEIPKPQEGALKLKKSSEDDFQDSIRQFSAEFPSSPSSANTKSTMSFADRMASATKAESDQDQLGKFKDTAVDDDFGDVPTIKIAKNRSPQKPIQFTTPLKTTKEAAKEMENMEDNLEFPQDGQPLRLSTHRETPRTPASQQLDDSDLDWAESSLGTRFGGTGRGARSNPSSSISAFSPSASSRLTGGESEDEGLDDLILPDGPFKFEDALKKRLENAPPELDETQALKFEDKTKKKQQEPAVQDDFLSGIDIGDGEVFDSGKLTLNRNIKQKVLRQTSPVRRTAMTLTFTNKIEPGISKIPRPQQSRSNLEPVYESGGPAPFSRRPGSRATGHSAQSSLSSIPTPSTSSLTNVAIPSTPSRHGLNQSASREALRIQPAANSSQWLKNKRSMPVIGRGQASPARPASRTGDYGNRQNLSSRPKTPVDRSGAESSLSSARKPPVPFLPAGMSNSQSHHISTKSSRHFHRPNSSDSNENVPVNRPLSRLSNLHRPITPLSRRDHAPESLAREAASKRQLTKPTRRRAFGDGNELEVFDDLPTSVTAESKFLKQPIARGAPKSVQLRGKLGMQQNNRSNASLNETSQPPPIPSTPHSPTKQESVPRFARDTNASRLAREQRIGSVSASLHPQRSLPTVRETGPLTSISTNWSKPGPPPASKHLASPMPHSKSRSKHKVPQKPRLIKPMNEGAINSAKTLKGMSWNPVLFRWEGNENALAPFDVPIPGPEITSPKSPLMGKAPALIANVGAGKAVQMSGGMVFDPALMCWLKMGPTRAKGSNSNPMSPETEEEEDPFAGIDDLDDETSKKAGPSKRDRSTHGSSRSRQSTGKKTALEDEDAPVQEEFDVGPEFIRRQRAEEERWRNKVAGWVGEGVKRDDGAEKGRWKWAIREKAMI